MTPQHVDLLLNHLPQYFDPHMTVELIDEMYQEERADESESHDQRLDLRDSPMVQRALERPAQLLELMRDIILAFKTIRRTAGVFDQFDNWQYFAKKISVDQFLAFIYAFPMLAEQDSTERKLAVTAARMYLVLLSTPGQKQTRAFDEQVLLKCLDVLKTEERSAEGMQAENDGRKKSQIDLIAILEDLELLLSCMTLKNCGSVKLHLVKWLVNVLKYCIKQETVRVFAEKLAGKCYEILSTICSPEHDDHNECVNNISLIFNKTALFYQQEYRNAPQTFQVYNFFLKLLEQHPKDTSSILTNFIKSVLTNPPKVFAKADDYAYLLDVAVKYELALYSKCNVSIVEYLSQLETQADSSTRSNTLEIIARLGTMECTVDWVLFRSEISTVPREIEMIRLVCNKLAEKNNSIKLKAFQCLLRLMQNGNQVVHQIFHDAFFRNYEDDEESSYLQMNDVEELYQMAEMDLGISRTLFHLPQQNKTLDDSAAGGATQEKASTSREDEEKTTSIEGMDAIRETLKSLPAIIYEALRSSNSAIRRVSFSCLEYILELDRNRIDDPLFASSVVQLAKDNVMLVRRTALNVLSKLLTLHPNYAPIIKLWSKCILIFLEDNDEKLKESAIESLKRNVFDNICRYEDSSSRKKFTPWLIVRSILVLGKINVLKAAIDSWVQKSFLTANNFSIIESHIYTVNYTEAWIVLSIIANKMKSKNPDVVIKILKEMLQQDVYNSTICLQYILSVIKSWLHDFSSVKLNDLFKMLWDILRTGSTNVSLVSSIYTLCCMILEKSNDMATDEWMHELRSGCANYLVHYRTNYLSSTTTNERYLITLLVYAEAVTDSNEKPDTEIINILLEYLSQLAASGESNQKPMQISANNVKKANVSITALAKFSLQYNTISTTVIPHFNRLLKHKRMDDSIICTLITAFADLCKRDPVLVNSSVNMVIGQLNSSCVSVRSVALINLNELILQDYVKMRGKVLLCILMLIIDENDLIAAQALYIVQQYVHTKNEKLLKESLLKCVFIFNQYLKYADSEMFPTIDAGSEECVLFGNADVPASKRIAIYDFFIRNIDDNSLLKLLENVKRIHEQLEKNKFVKCKQGVGTLLDLLYVFKQICEVRYRDKPRGAREESEMSQDLIENDIQEEQPPGAKKSKLSIAQTQAERDVTTIVGKTVDVYFRFDQSVRKYVQAVEPQRMDLANQRLHELSTAIAENFRSSVEFAEPMKFWRKLLETIDKSESTSSNRRKKVVDADETNSP
ncbi:condensin-2 complex subunit D3 [Anopheles aquasalis]|uniref:condensin-2 complex subunit D3 n=1 Tax=Anopheles aquasalis TaxID=42839 RepID=UPI00215AEFC3|nr:condensin-2 complex subunit D3 [Anopheles aquasalis]